MKYVNNIVLIGFMGCGKTSIGTLLADSLDIICVDTDIEIEKDMNIKISQIFDVYGEQFFRFLEKQKINELSKNENQIITTGGGAVLDNENVVALKKNGILIYLHATYEQIYTNLKNDNSRPLLNDADKEKKIKELLDARSPLYENVCDYIVYTTNKKMTDVLDDVKKIISHV